MKIILLEDLDGKGRPGDVINASDGYARNYLLPKGIAIEATASNLKTMEHRRAKLAEKRMADLESAKAVAEKIDNLSVTIKSKAGESGKLFGAVTAQDVADAINTEHSVFIDKKKIVMHAHIKETGVHPIEIKIFPEVSATVRVLVEAL